MGKCETYTTTTFNIQLVKCLKKWKRWKFRRWRKFWKGNGAYFYFTREFLTKCDFFPSSCYSHTLMFLLVCLQFHSFSLPLIEEHSENSSSVKWIRKFRKKGNKNLMNVYCVVLFLQASKSKWKIWKNRMLVIKSKSSWKYKKSDFLLSKNNTHIAERKKSICKKLIKFEWEKSNRCEICNWMHQRVWWVLLSACAVSSWQLWIFQQVLKMVSFSHEKTLFSLLCLTASNHSQQQDPVEKN